MTSADPPTLAEAGAATSPVDALGAAITKEFPRLRITVQMLVWKLHLADRRQDVPDLADEVLSETVAQAIKLVDRWDPARGTRPWIAALADATGIQASDLYWERFRRAVVVLMMARDAGGIQLAAARKRNTRKPASPTPPNPPPPKPDQP